ncbi:LysR family transcriptional regulator [Photorhabdus khanii]|uniref:LysR family transcriptional regulator n=1 Tax=Photorhabdus khanii TaxID=1004150 RepID=A0A7C9GQK1_9GAMM|nr:LysR family transcriptional regulator [Photorhabdus khanii]MQL49390.1 LysR family transcriptional regulator [Photorhabdus khanii]
MDINRFRELEVFICVVENGSFSAAARTCGMTPSAISKLISRLESRLGSRLFNRSTRQLQFTLEGQLFYERGVGILAELNEAERSVSECHVPRGRLRVNANVTFGHHFLLPLIPIFSSLYPDITLDIVLTDTVVDILGQRSDIAVRAGPLKDSSLIARKLGQAKMVIVGSPLYLQKRGIPQHPDDLGNHNLLSANYMRSINGWPFVVDGVRRQISTKGTIQASDGEALRYLAIEHGGLARLAKFRVKDDINRNKLCTVLDAFHMDDMEDIHAVFVGHGGYMPLRVRAFLDFLVDNVNIDSK